MIAISAEHTETVLIGDALLSAYSRIERELDAIDERMTKRIRKMAKRGELTQEQIKQLSASGMIF